MSALDHLEACMSGQVPVTVEALGGVDCILADIARLAASPFLDMMVAMIDAASAAEREKLSSLLVEGFDKATEPQSFRDAIGMLVGSEALRVALAPKLVPVFTRRIRNRSGDRDALIAAFALEGLFRLALDGVVSRHRPLLELAEITQNECSLFAQHAAKIGGAAFHVWGGDDLLAMLHRLLNISDAEGEAAFELGLAYLARALDGADMARIEAGLEASRTLFDRACAVDENRTDALAYRSAIDLVRGFAAGRSATELQGLLDDLVAAVRDRTALLRVGAIAPWLAPREDRDLEWFCLSCALQQAAGALGRPSWVNAAVTMGHVLAVYDAHCTIARGTGLEILVRPRIEATFIRERGLIAHLDDLLGDEQWTGAFRPVADRLRAELDAQYQAGAGPGKAGENEHYPLLTRILPEGAATEQIPANMARSLEAALASYVGGRQALANPVLQRIRASLREQLSGSSEYVGEVRQAFDAVLEQLLLFCSDRQNADIRDLGPRGAYLRADDASEADLQADLRDFLKGNLACANVLSEVRGVATGRTDLYISIGGLTFIIELKKHNGEFSREAAERYRPQATSYQATNVRLGFLGVLELIDRRGPVPSIEECLWHSACVPEGGVLTRHLIVFKVPGRLKSPSALR